MKTIQAEVARTTLRTVTAKTEILYDPIPDTTVIEEDKEFVDAFFAIPDDEVTANLHRQSPWLLRLELDRGSEDLVGLRRTLSPQEFPCLVVEAQPGAAVQVEALS